MVTVPHGVLPARLRPGRRELPTRPIRCLGASLAAAWALAGCGGGGDPAQAGAVPVAPAPAPMAPAPSVPPPAPMPPPAGGAAILPPPVLSFNDTGLSVSDGVTRNGLWSVDSPLDWEFSLDLGTTWVRGSGKSFEVTGDGPKMIWVRTRDDLGNTSPIVMVTCVLDTTAPPVPSSTDLTRGVTRVLRIEGVESGARWEYAFAAAGPWRGGQGPGLGVLGNGLGTVWLRQVDLAGNASMARPVALDVPADGAWHEASGDPLTPSVLDTVAAQTFLLHGSVVRGDADYVRWETAADQRIESIRLVDYVSEDLVAFYALQRSPVFDAGVDVNRMLAWGHIGPDQLMRDLLATVPPGLRGPGPMTLWFQQTGPLPTRYVVELVLQPAR